MSSETGTFEMVLRSASELPLVKIDRSTFLQKELSRFFDEETVNKAVETTPAQAGIHVKELERIAKACINYETGKVTALSAAAGIPGGFAMIGTVPADVAQLFGHIIRILQKLTYLYGWQDLFQNKDGVLDDETANQLTLFIGVMFGVNAANVAITKIANNIAIRTVNVLPRMALTKGAIYPIVKQIAKMLGVRMTKVMFAKGIGKAIPIIGGVASGSITFAFFRPMAKRLQKYLVTLPVADVGFYEKPHTDNIVDIDEIDFSDIVFEDVEESK